MRFADFDLYKDLLKEKAGLYLSPDKSYLLDSRLSPVAAKWKYPSVTTMTHALRGIAEPGLIKDVVEAMIEQETSFFRQPGFYKALEDFLPKLTSVRNAGDPVQFWVAGCATGQEAWSLAMFLKDSPHLLGPCKTNIVATDISSKNIEAAKTALYDQDAVQHGLSAKILLDHLAQEGREWQIKPKLQSMVTFRYSNLLDSMEPLGYFDVISCCNVLDRMDEEVRDKVRTNLEKQLVPGGFLFTGDDEALAL